MKNKQESVFFLFQVRLRHSHACTFKWISASFSVQEAALCHHVMQLLWTNVRTLHDTQRRCFSMETFHRAFFFHYWKFHSSGILSSFLFLSIIFTFLIIHFNSVRITSNEVIVLESCHLCLLSSYFIFKDLFSTSLCTSYLSYNPINTIMKKN